MDLQNIAVRGAWRELIPPGLRRSLEQLEAQGVRFFWTCSGESGRESYLFSAGTEDALLASHDGSETPRQAISEVILEAMTACGAFPQQAAPSSSRARRRGSSTSAR